jgi:hypothetical protein
MSGSQCQEKLNRLYRELLRDCMGEGGLPEFQTANAVLAWAMLKMSETEPGRWGQIVLQHVDALEQDQKAYKELLFSDSLGLPSDTARREQLVAPGALRTPICT